MAEGDAAVHAAGGLLLDEFAGPLLVEFQVVPGALPDGALEGEVAGELHEAGGLAHGAG